MVVLLVVLHGPPPRACSLSYMDSSDLSGMFALGGDKSKVCEIDAACVGSSCICGRDLGRLSELKSELSCAVGCIRPKPKS